MRDIRSVSAQIDDQPADAVALRANYSTLTYAELQAQANRMTAYLIKRGVQPGGAVAVCLPRSFDWIVASLAIMRAGAAYVPMDLAWPKERLRLVMADSGATHLIAAPAMHVGLETGVVSIDPREAVTAAASTTPLTESDLPGESLAYLIYTSGSTGVPKGVEITHANLAHLIAWHKEAFAVTSNDRASHVAGLSFDAAGWEIWPYLAAGATVSLVDEAVRTSADLLQGWLLRERITMSFVPTALAAPLIAAAWPQETALRYLLTGGDTLHRGPRSGLPFAVVNNYGPTECTVVATSGQLREGDEGTPSIGRPISGAEVYLLDDAGLAVEPGEVGEMYVAGAGVGRGYHNRPEETAKSFLPDTISRRPGARMYRTGDRGVLLPNGEIGFRGRLDGQEKIRGQRVELEEITSVLSRHPKVEACVVVSHTTASQEKTLLAYVLPVVASHPTSRELQEYLSEQLPAFMVPSVFAKLDALPLSYNGKIDRSALRPPDADTLLPVASTRPAQSPVEERLLATVRALLETDEVAVDDDFFLIGGHSLLGTQLVLRTRAAFDIDLTLRDLFEARTVERLAVKVEDRLIAQVDELSDAEILRQMEETR